MATPSSVPGNSQYYKPSLRDRYASFHLKVPIAGITGIWSPLGDRATLQKISWHGKIAGTPTFAPPVMALVDASLRNHLLLLVEPFNHECEIAWHLNQADACYEIQVRWDGELPPDARILINTQPESIHQLVPPLLAAMRTPSAPVLPHHYEPTYCTWYAFHADQQVDRIEQAARLARDLGFGTLIVDDGWSYQSPQRVGTSIAHWHRFQGDYLPDNSKYPDFPAHVQRIKAMGLRYLLWISPFIVGDQSKAATELQDDLLDSWLSHEGFKALDPRSDPAIESIAEKLCALVEFCRPDGFKVDYDYALAGPGQRSLNVGAAYANAASLLIERCRKINPDLEWNLVCNLFASTITSCMRCVDVPYDAASNRLYIGNMKPLAAGMALQSDPALWSAGDSAAMVHQHIVPTLFCVPSIGASLTALPAEHLTILRNWLQFYRRHQPLLNHGSFSARWAAGDYQSFHVSDEHQEIIAGFSSYPIDILPQRNALLINAGPEPQVTLRLTSAHTIILQNPRGDDIDQPRHLARGLHGIRCDTGNVIHIAS